jgi:hypothetical protein
MKCEMCESVMDRGRVFCCSECGHGLGRDGCGWYLARLFGVVVPGGDFDALYYY